MKEAGLSSKNTGTQMDALSVVDRMIKVQEQSQGLKEHLLSEPDYEKVYTDEEYEKEKKRLIFKEHYLEYIIKFGFILIVIHTLLYAFRSFQASYYLNVSYLKINFILAMIWLISPFILWVYSTSNKELIFHKRKLSNFYICILQILFFMENLIQSAITSIINKLLLMIPISRFVTQSMVVTLGRILVLIIPLFITVLIGSEIMKILNEENMQKAILGFFITDYIDQRKDVEFCYDLRIVRDLKTADTYIIKEGDRPLHSLIDGTTGTGKTSSCMSTSIADDLDQKRTNIIHQKKVVEKLLAERHVHLKRYMDDKDFNLNFFEPDDKKGADVLKELAKVAKNAGMTIVSPNDGLADDAYELGKARGFKVNRLDPMITKDGTHKEGFIGINPLYIPPDLSPLQRNLEVVKKSRVAADVMQALYEMNGKGDPYFTSLNRNITTCVTIIVLLTYDYLHEKQPAKYPLKYPTFIIIQDIINDFKLASPYADAYDKMCSELSDAQRGYKKGDYSFVLSVIRNDLLGEGRDKMFDQARGLRTQINEFLTNPLFKEALCTQESIDLDKALRDGEITVVNYCLELGRSDAVAFGLFFVLSFNNAVLRRPKDSRIPHFFDVDEFPVLLHPSMEECFTLFRQYNVSMMVAIQTLDQMERSDTTKYLKGILLGNCAHQFVFGRLSPTDMEVYEKMSGVAKEEVAQHTVSETPLVLEDTSMSFSTRTSMMDAAILKGSDMRYNRFQVVTVFTVNDGAEVEPFYGKVDFVATHKKLKRQMYTVDWSIYQPGDIPTEISRQSLTLSNLTSTLDAVSFYEKGDSIKSDLNKEHDTNPATVRLTASMPSNGLFGLAADDGNVCMSTSNTFEEEHTVSAPSSEKECIQEPKEDTNPVSEELVLSMPLEDALKSVTETSHELAQHV